MDFVSTRRFQAFVWPVFIIRRLQRNLSCFSRWMTSSKQHSTYRLQKPLFLLAVCRSKVLDKVTCRKPTEKMVAKSVVLLLLTFCTQVQHSYSVKKARRKN